MAALDDLKERFQTEFQGLWEKIQESSLFIQLREKYENLTPTMQRLTLAGIAIVLGYLFLSVPLSYFTASTESVTTFEDKRQLIRDLLKVSREAQETPTVPVPPDVNALRSQVDGQIQTAKLLPEQIRPTEVTAERVNLIPGGLIQGALKVTLMQLNLRQIVDLGYQFQAISPSIKMTDLQMEANAKDPRYYDVTYKMAVLNVPSQAEPVAEEPPPPTKKKGK